MGKYLYRQSLLICSYSFLIFSNLRNICNRFLEHSTYSNQLKVLSKILYYGGHRYFTSKESWGWLENHPVRTRYKTVSIFSYYSATYENKRFLLSAYYVFSSLIVFHIQWIIKPPLTSNFLFMNTFSKICFSM